MTMRDKKFEIDRENGKVLGVCAGIANLTGLDVTLVRIGFVLVTVLGAFPWTLAVYGVAYWVGKPKARSSYAMSRSTSSSPSREEARQRIRDLDLRMQAIETYVTSSNSTLAREIEELR